MSAWTLIYDIIKTGFVIAGCFGIGWLIGWAFKRNIKSLFDLRKPNKEMVDWLVEGLRQGHDDDDLKVILLEKEAKPKELLKALKVARKIIVKEEEIKNARKKRKIGSPEKEIERLKKRVQRARGK